MKAVYNGQVVAEAPKENLIFIEGNWYFPPSSVKTDMLTKSPTPYTCPWKGVCQYFNVGEAQDAAWSYPEPYPSAIPKVKKDFTNYVAFWREVQVTE